MTGSNGTETRSRPSWDDVWIDISMNIASRSLCVRAQVGAVIVDNTNRIISTGYNGPAAGFPHEDKPCTAWCNRSRNEQVGYMSKTYDDCPALHAEANALMTADRSTWQGGTIYVLGDVCIGCAKLIANSGLSTVVVHPVGDAAHREPAKSYALLELCGLTVVIE